MSEREQFLFFFLLFTSFSMFTFQISFTVSICFSLHLILVTSLVFHSLPIINCRLKQHSTSMGLYQVLPSFKRNGKLKANIDLKLRKQVRYMDKPSTKGNGNCYLHNCIAISSQSGEGCAHFTLGATGLHGGAHSEAVQDSNP